MKVLAFLSFKGGIKSLGASMHVKLLPVYNVLHCDGNFFNFERIIMFYDAIDHQFLRHGHINPGEVFILIYLENLMTYK